MTDQAKQEDKRKIPTRLLIMRPDGSREVQTHLMSTNPGIAELNAILKPLLGLLELDDYIERVAVFAPFEEKPLDKRDMFVDEIGQQKGLPRNEEATEHYRRATMLGRSAEPKPADPEELPDVVGSAVLFERTVWR